MDGHPPRVGVGLPVPTSDDVAASLGDHPLLGCDVAATALDELAEPVARLERVVEQIAGAPVPQILESFVDGEQVPKERVQNRVGEPIGAVPVPQIW